MVPVYQSVTARKITNQIVILATFRKTTDTSETYHSYICLVNLDFVDGETRTDKIVQVHSIVIERASQHGYGIEST